MPRTEVKVQIWAEGTCLHTGNLPRSENSPHASLPMRARFSEVVIFGHTVNPYYRKMTWEFFAHEDLWWHLLRFLQDPEPTQGL